MLGLIGCLMFTERTSSTLSLRQLAVKVTEMDFRGVRVPGEERKKKSQLLIRETMLSDPAGVHQICSPDYKPYTHTIKLQTVYTRVKTMSYSDIHRIPDQRMEHIYKCPAIMSKFYILHLHLKPTAFLLNALLNYKHDKGQFDARLDYTVTQVEDPDVSLLKSQIPECIDTKSKDHTDTAHNAQHV